jgi:CHAT domain-containing protein/tetratricopeptide (TPR) repeat protein
MKISKFISLSYLSIFIFFSPLSNIFPALSQETHSFETRNFLVSKIEIKEEYLSRFNQINELPNVSFFELLGSTSLVSGQKLFESQQYEAAIQSWEKALLEFRQKNSKFSESLTLSTISSAHMISGDYKNSIYYGQQALKIARDIKNPLLEGFAYSALGATYTGLGEYEVAIQYSQAALSIAKNLKKAYPKHSLSDLFSTIEGSALVNLAMTFAFDSKDYDKAIGYATQSLNIATEIKSLSLRGTALNVLGGAYYGKNKYALAIQYFQEGLIPARASLDKRREGYILNYLGFALWKAQKLEAAEKVLREGVAVWESVRASYRSDRNKVSVLDVQAKTYRSLQQVLIARNKPEAALEAAERGRSRALVEILAKRSANITVNDVSIAPPNIKAIQSIAKTHNSTLVEYSIIYQESEVEEVKPSEKEAQLLIWVVKPTGEISLRQVDLASQPKSLKQSVLDLLDERSDSLFSNINPQTKLQNLHRLLIQPIADLLPPDPTAPVIFIPQDVLYRVPFVALQDERGKYLIEQHTVLSAPSIQVLDLTYQQHQRLRDRGNGALAVGFPRSGIIVGNPTGANLKVAEKEAIAIATILGTQALIGQDATKSRVLARLSDAKVIHLATHGKYVDDKGAGLQSALAFAPAGQDRGLLTASEIFDLKLSANLVVLSACNSGRGEITGEGVIGLSRAFIAAGVPSLVLSLWSIKDEDSAVTFMQQVYQNLKQGQDKAQSLRQAMLYMVQRGKPVRDWAAFTLIGESEQ